MYFFSSIPFFLGLTFGCETAFKDVRKKSDTWNAKRGWIDHHRISRIFFFLYILESMMFYCLITEAIFTQIDNSWFNRPDLLNFQKNCTFYLPLVFLTYALDPMHDCSCSLMCSQERIWPIYVDRKEPDCHHGVRPARPPGKFSMKNHLKATSFQ